MVADEQQGRRPRVHVQRNRVALLDAAQRHFLAHGVGTPLEAVAKEAGVGLGTLYRHFPSREALLAAVLQSRSMEDYFSAFSGLPEPLMAAARAHDPGNPLTLPCETLISATEGYVRAAPLAGHVRPSVKGYDLFLAAVSIAWVKGTAAIDEESSGRLRSLIENGYSEPREWV
ncbi:helix-turn-helix domain-containing protein [Streptomyces sp. NPDC005799]|uniref:TetR/AcrR family transcriptional regulator n=1 Tax=Streptomyces sp. NPDC005799 TaxID=3154678 RepID=UPI0033CE64C2